jgi:hypothetical protein
MPRVVVTVSTEGFEGIGPELSADTEKAPCEFGLQLANLFYA